MLVSFKVLIDIARFLLIITSSQISLYALSQLNLHVCSHKFTLVQIIVAIHAGSHLSIRNYMCQHSK